MTHECCSSRSLSTKITKIMGKHTCRPTSTVVRTRSIGHLNIPIEYARIRQHSQDAIAPNTSPISRARCRVLVCSTYEVGYSRLHGMHVEKGPLLLSHRPMHSSRDGDNRQGAPFAEERRRFPLHPFSLIWSSCRRCTCRVTLNILTTCSSERAEEK